MPQSPELFASAVLGLSAVAPLAAPQTAKADHWEYHHEHHHRRHYEVFYRRDCNCEWRCAGRFDCYEDAAREARHLRHHGFEVSIRD